MSVPPDRFSRITGRVNLDVLQQCLVVIVGIGTVGSQIAKELANSGLGRLRLIDGDILEQANLSRHVLPQQHIGHNKAEGLALHLTDEISQLQVEALNRYVDDDIPQDTLNALLADADLIVAATDDRRAQRRLGRRALSLDIPAVFPALYGDEGGEVFVQFGSSFPCFLCWDAFRSEDARPRGVTALNLDTLALIQLAGRLCLGILDRSSDDARLLRTDRNAQQPQLFIQNQYTLAIESVERRPNCPACRVGPARRPQAFTSFHLSSPVEVDDRRSTRPSVPVLTAIAILSTIIAITVVVVIWGSHDHSLPSRRILGTQPPAKGSERPPNVQAKALAKPPSARLPGIGEARMSPDKIKQVLGRPYRTHSYGKFWLGLYRTSGGIIGVYYGRTTYSKKLVAGSYITNSPSARTSRNVRVGDRISAAARAYSWKKKDRDMYSAGFVTPNFYRQSPSWKWVFPPQVTAHSRVYEYWLNPSGGERLVFSTAPYSKRIAWIGIGTCCFSYEGGVARGS